jgi:hypothetical protein
MKKILAGAYLILAIGALLWTLLPIGTLAGLLLAIAAAAGFLLFCASIVFALFILGDDT